MTRLYLDHNATSPMKPDVKQAMIDALDLGNPSSVHKSGRIAKAAMEQARADLCQALDAPENACTFTGGGTEAINMALWGMVKRDKDPVRHLLVSAIEHDAMIKTARAIEQAGLAKLEFIPVDGEGLVDPAWLVTRAKELQSEGVTFLASIMLANNETGVVQDIKSLAPMVFTHGGFLLVDAAQAIGKIPLSFNSLQADLMIVVAHKFAGPKGVGALMIKPGLVLAPLMQGGGQEMGLRPGTQNVAAIVAMGAAAKAINLGQAGALQALRDEIEDGLGSVSDIKVWSEDAPRLGNTLCFSSPGFAADVQVMALDLEGIEISSGSACSSGKVKKSHVLQAMGADSEQAGSAIRISLGWDTPDTAPQEFLRAWKKAHARASKTRAA
jgi:cysteine desulfurase